MLKIMQKTMRSKRILFVLLSAVVIWGLLSLSGVIRVLPKRAIDYYSKYCSRDTVIEKSIGRPIHCPFCYGCLSAMYYGIGDWHEQDHDNRGNPVWEWGGCIYDGNWICNRCGMRYDSKGHSMFLHKLRERIEVMTDCQFYY